MPRANALPECTKCGCVPGRKTISCDVCRELLCTKCRIRPATTSQTGKKKSCADCKESARKAGLRRRTKAKLQSEKIGWNYCQRCHKSFSPEGTCYCERARQKNGAPKSTAPGTIKNIGKQMRAPYEHAVEEIYREIKTVLQSADASDNTLLQGYNELLRVSEERDIFAPIATLSKEYFEPTKIRNLLRGDVEFTFTEENSECKVLAVTNEQLDELRQAGKSLPDCISCLLIPAESGARNDTFEVFQSQCNGWETSVEYQQYDQTKDLTSFMELPAFLDRVAQRQRHPELRSILDKEGFPINVLSLSAEVLGSAFREPLAITALRYRLLSFLSKRSQIREVETGIGKVSKQPAQLADLDACLKFLLYGERGSFSGYHMDVLNGTWVQCQTGLKLWLIYSGPWDEDVQKRYASEGSDWMPPPETIQAILLRPGDTLIMRPGYPVIHAVLTVDDAFMTGGMIWPETSLAPVMANLGYILRYDCSTNELVPRQLPQILSKLEVHIRTNLESSQNGKFYAYPQSDLDSLQELISYLKEQKLFHCECKSKCGKKCPCMHSTRHHHGCTLWCHNQLGVRLDGCCLFK